jgi:hypothetical protein
MNEKIINKALVTATVIVFLCFAVFTIAAMRMIKTEGHKCMQSPIVWGADIYSKSNGYTWCSCFINGTKFDINSSGVINPPPRSKTVIELNLSLLKTYDISETAYQE